MRWNRIYRNAAMINAIISSIWTLIIIFPEKPFSYILPIIAGGGPGTWLILGYVLYLIVGFCGFSCFSMMFKEVEDMERKKVDQRFATTGFLMTYSGMSGATFLLGMAGGIGGYAFTIQHLPVQVVRDILLPYVNIISFLTTVAIIGVLLNLITLMTSKKELS